MQVQIKLNDRDRSQKPINVDLQWNVEVTEPKKGWLPGIFRRHNQISRDLKLTVTNIVVDKEIDCDKNKLFSILYNTRLIPQAEFPVDVRLTDMKLPFQLLFHQEEIRDCNTPQDSNPRVHSITYDVILRDNSGNEVDKVSEKVEIVFQPLNVSPGLNIDVENEEIQYDSTLGVEQVGVFAAYMNEEFKYTPTQLAEVSIKLCKNGKEIPGIAAFESGESSKTIKITGGRQNVVSLPVTVDFRGIQNPVSAYEDYTLESKIVLSPEYSPEIKKTVLKQENFRLLKDTQGTELKVYANKLDSPEMMMGQNQTSLSVPLSFVPKSRLMGVACVTLANIATASPNPRAGLYIKNLTLSESVDNDVKIIGEDRTEITNFVKAEGPGVDAMRSTVGLFIPNGLNARTVIRLSFNPERIADVINSKTYDFRVRTVLSFDYWEDKDGLGNLDEADKKVCKIPVIWELHLKPNPEWLAVDYGSSAIVCRYDTEVLNLKKQKDKIFRSEMDGKFMRDRSEKDTKFLSSDIVLHSVRYTKGVPSSLCSQNRNDQPQPYLNLAVCLSPTTSLIDYEVRTQLPCLKILVGNEVLPPKPDYKLFSYAREKNGEVEAVKAEDALKNGEETSLLRVSSLFNEAYSALFGYFISPVSRDRSINKLVLTYPNTYTPAHLQVLEKIVRNTFPKVRDGYLRFVSESDAVASYYLKNWSSINHGIAERKIDDKETVLVYDMGAGTLDLTLLRKRRGTDGKIQVDILGKIGTGKAGNYLDYIISEIISEKVAGAVANKTVVSTGSVANETVLNERNELKRVVKEEIKPNLKPNAQISTKWGMIDSSIILEDPRYVEFVKQVTSGLLSRLLSGLKPNERTIDTILMSGRSSRLCSLKPALRNYLDNHGSGSGHILEFETGSDKDKTVVVEGATVRVANFSSEESPVRIRSRRLYASYGLVYQVLGGRYRYVELLNGSEMPFVTDQTELDDFEGSNVLAEGTAAAGKIKLVQTYLSAKDTESAYNKGDMEFISEMEEYDMSEFDGRDTLNVKLKLDYRNRISLYVNGTTSVGCPPQGVDLRSEITKRSVWPVSI